MLHPEISMCCDVPEEVTPMMDYFSLLGISTDSFPLLGLGVLFRIDVNTR